MSIFDWFSRKQSKNSHVNPEAKGFGQVDATALRSPSGSLEGKSVSPLPGHPLNRKIERLEHREFLYKVVRDAMIRAGILATSYKFKVLSLDGHGLRYLIMMDLFNPTVVTNARLTEIETMIAQAAKMRHDMTVTGVYWRVTELAGPSQSQLAHKLQPPPKTSALHPPAYEPLLEDEVAAFKRALASVTPAAAHGTSGSTVISGRRNPAPPADFEDTKRIDSDDRASPLSGTQYGDLN